MVVYKPRSAGNRHAAIGLLLMSLVGAAVAQSGGGSYTLRKQAVTAGGRSTAADWALGHSLAEPGAGTQSGGGYRLTAGLQTPRLRAPEGVFANGFE